MPLAEVERKRRAAAPAESLEPAPDVMTVLEVAALLRVHTATIYKMLSSGELPAFRIGADWRFNRDDIDRWRRREDGSDR